MAREQIVVGLEIGTSKIAAVVGDVRPDQPLRILGVGLTPSRGVRKGEIVDLDFCSVRINFGGKIASMINVLILFVCMIKNF